jgi:hypothetical protein
MIKRCLLNTAVHAPTTRRVFCIDVVSRHLRQCLYLYFIICVVGRDMQMLPYDTPHSSPGVKLLCKLHALTHLMLLTVAQLSIFVIANCLPGCGPQVRQ